MISLRPLNPHVLFHQIGKEHLGLKAITEVLQDLQYKVSRGLITSSGQMINNHFTNDA